MTAYNFELHRYMAYMAALALTLNFIVLISALITIGVACHSKARLQYRVIHIPRLVDLRRGPLGELPIGEERYPWDQQRFGRDPGHYMRFRAMPERNPWIYAFHGSAHANRIDPLDTGLSEQPAPWGEGMGGTTQQKEGGNHMPTHEQARDEIIKNRSSLHMNFTRNSTAQTSGDMFEAVDSHLYRSRFSPFSSDDDDDEQEQVHSSLRPSARVRSLDGTTIPVLVHGRNRSPRHFHAEPRRNEAPHTHFEHFNWKDDDEDLLASQIKVIDTLGVEATPIDTNDQLHLPCRSISVAALRGNDVGQLQRDVNDAHNRQNEHSVEGREALRSAALNAEDTPPESDGDICASEAVKQRYLDEQRLSRILNTPVQWRVEHPVVECYVTSGVCGGMGMRRVGMRNDEMFWVFEKGGSSKV